MAYNQTDSPRSSNYRILKRQYCIDGLQGCYFVILRYRPGISTDGAVPTESHVGLRIVESDKEVAVAG